MRKFKNRKLPRGILVDRGLVYVRLFPNGKQFQKCYGNVNDPDVLNTAIDDLHHIREQMRLGRFKKEAKVRRVPFNEIVELFIVNRPYWRTRFKGLQAYFDNCFFDEITFSRLEGYRSWAINNIKVKRFVGNKLVNQPISQSTVNHHLRGLSALYKAVKRMVQVGDMVPVSIPEENPVTLVRNKQLCRGGWYDERVSRRRRVLSSEEFQLFMDNATPKIQKACLLALNTALSRKDLFALTPNNLAEYAAQLEGIRSKVGHVYTIPANDNVKSLFEMGEQLDDKNFRNEFEASRKRFMEKGGKFFQWRDLRRTALQWIYNVTKDIVLCQTVAAHSDVSTTQRYLGITNADIQKAGQALQKIFSYPIKSSI